MDKKEQYNKAIAKVITFDISDPIITGSSDFVPCEWDEKHRSDCQQYLSTRCADSKYAAVGYGV